MTLEELRVEPLLILTGKNLLGVVPISDLDVFWTPFLSDDMFWT